MLTDILVTRIHELWFESVGGGGGGGSFFF